MSGLVRALILTAVLVPGALLALIAWSWWLHSFLALRFTTPSWLAAYEQFAFVLASAPVLLVLGAFAFWLHEPQRRRSWTMVFSLAVGASLSWMAPTLALRGQPLMLAFYWVAIAALAMLILLSGSWLAAKLLQLAASRASKRAA